MGQEDDDELQIEIAVANYAVSGPKARRCVFLAMRYDAGSGYRPGDGETWIAGNDLTVDFEGCSMVMNGTAAWYTRVWSTLSGYIFVTRHDGWVIRNPDIFAPDPFSAWENDHIEGYTLMGVFGIDESSVFVWGHDPMASDDIFPASEVFRWEGRGWNPMGGPGFHIITMHGTAPDDLWAGGPQGALAHWDGRRWTRVPSGDAALINSIWAAAPDEIYATTTSGKVLEGSRKGAQPIGAIPGADMPADVQCVAKWNDQLWVGAGRLGLLRRKGKSRKFESVKPNIDCVAMDARDELVMCCEGMIAGTPNGTDFAGYGVDVVLTEREPYELLQNMG